MIDSRRFLHEEEEVQHHEVKKKKRRVMNTIGPLLVVVSILLNIWTVLIYFVFPYTDWIFLNYQRVRVTDIGWHYALAAIYFILLFMTVWSYLAARYFEPGFMPRDARGYEVEKLPDKERILWQYLEKHETLIRLHAELAQDLQAQEVGNPKIVATSEGDETTPAMTFAAQTHDQDAKAVELLITHSDMTEIAPKTDRSASLQIIATSPSAG